MLVTGWIILRWLKKIPRREKKEEEISQKEKMVARLDIVMTDSRPVKTYGQYSQYEDDSGRELSFLHQELLSVQAVLEIKTEEGRRLREELDRMEEWREDKGTMTEETFSDRMVIFETCFLDFHDNCFSGNKRLTMVSVEMK